MCDGNCTCGKEEEKKEPRSLYRFENYEPLDDETYVNWIWLTDSEYLEYVDGEVGPHRAATADEAELYNEAYADGYGMAAILEFESGYDGITFRLNLGENKEFDNTKMFQCAVCDRHLDFEDNVANAGGMYLGAIRNEKLWHICYDCARGNAEVEWIEQGWVWDDDDSPTSEPNS